MRTSELDFDLPRELIATKPVEPRDSARLLVVQRSDPGRLEHRAVRDLPGLLEAGDTLVFNRSRVLPARLVGVNVVTGGSMSGLFLAEVPGGCWRVLIRTKRPRVDGTIELIDSAGARTGVVMRLLTPDPEEGPGAWIVSVEGGDSAERILDRAGHTPLPPYILSARKERGDEVADAFDRDHYQTMFAGDETGSIAAPTAGLHFTDRVIEDLRSRDIARAEVTLHVGSGTFRPVDADNLNDHPMHSERCSIGDAGSLVGGERSGRVLAVGSTSVRTLEAAAGLIGTERERVLEGGWFETDILIAPGYRWGVVEGMVTNFHLPKSTLLAMVAASLEGPGIDGVARVHEIYREAIRVGYRFFSYGDAMLILP